MKNCMQTVDNLGEMDKFLETQITYTDSRRNKKSH